MAQGLLDRSSAGIVYDSKHHKYRQHPRESQTTPPNLWENRTASFTTISHSHRENFRPIPPNRINKPVGQVRSCCNITRHREGSIPSRKSSLSLGIESSNNFAFVGSSYNWEKPNVVMAQISRYHLERYATKEGTQQQGCQLAPQSSSTSHNLPSNTSPFTQKSQGKGILYFPMLLGKTPIPLSITGKEIQYNNYQGC